MKPWLLERAARTPDAVALIARGEPTSYAELCRQAERQARALLALDCLPGARVAALFGNEPAFVPLFHAAQRARLVLVPLNVRLTAGELARQLADCGARWLVHGNAEPLRTAAHDAARLAGASPVAAAELCDGPSLPAPHELAPDEAAALVYTSGTSGAAKAVVLTHGNLFASALGSLLHLGALPSDRWLACLPLFHVGGLAILARSALAGSAVLLHERFDPLEVSRALDADALTLASFVPTMLARVLDARGATPPPATLRAVLLGGAGAPPALLERAAARGWPILPTYGLTEAASQVATLPPGATLRSDGGGLQPLFGVEIRICAEDGREQPSGVAGEIRVRGATVSPSAGEWLCTGDLGVRAADGSLALVGRADDMLISGGENVHPAEVEAALAAHPDVAEVAVAGLPDPLYGQRVAAWIVLAPGARAGTAELEAFARARLAGYKLPRAFRFVTELPRGASGKLLRRALV